MNDKLLNMLGLCRRAGRMKIGCDLVIESAKVGDSVLILMASDISENTKKKVTLSCDNTPTEILRYSKDELSFALGKTCAVLSIEDPGFAGKINELIQTQNYEGGEI